MITTVCKISYGSQTVPPIVPAVQGDTGRAISFEIADFTPPAGATATYFILKPSGEAIYNSATITDNSILCELTAQSLAEAGENRMQVRVLQGEDIVTSFEVILMVRTFLGDDAMESGTEMNIFDQAVAQATEQFQENAEQIVAEVIQSIPSDYTELTEEVDELNERLSEAIDDFAVPTQEAVNNWLDEHPEATTTVQDGSLTYKKLVTGTLGFVTPEMFGATGDEETNDSTYVQDAVNYCVSTGLPLCLAKKYAVGGIVINGKIVIRGISSDNSGFIDIDGITPLISAQNASYSLFENFKIDFLSDRTVPAFDISDSHSVVFDGVWANALSYAGTLDVPTIKVYKKTSEAITYLTRIRNCKFIFASVYLESTDSLIENNVFNGRYCNHALELYKSDNTLISGNEIVPGIESAIYLDSANNIEGIKIVGNYFDGGTNTDVTGCAVKSNKIIVHSIISSNNFWKIKKEGVHLLGARYTNICNNAFQECGYSDQTLNDITLDNLSFGINVNSNNFYRANWYNGSSVVSRSSGMCKYLYLASLPSTAVYISHIIGNIVNDISKYTLQDYGFYYISKYNGNTNTNERTVTLSALGGYISTAPTCKVLNNVCTITGKLQVENNIPMFTTFASGCPTPSANAPGIMFSASVTAFVYVDSSGYLHCGDTVDIPTGEYRLIVQYPVP